jgi:hypothetical protein
MMTYQTGSKLEKKVCENSQRIVSISLTHHQELTEVAVLNCDLSAIPITDFDRFQNPKTKRPYYVAYLICKMLLCGTSLEVEIHWNERIICNTMIKDIRSTTTRS